MLLRFNIYLAIQPLIWQSITVPFLTLISPRILKITPLWHKYRIKKVKLLWNAKRRKQLEASLNIYRTSLNLAEHLLASFHHHWTSMKKKQPLWTFPEAFLIPGDSQSGCLWYKQIWKCIFKTENGFVRRGTLSPQRSCYSSSSSSLSSLLSLLSPSKPGEAPF